MFRDYVWTILITYMIATIFGIVVGMSDFTWWGSYTCGAVGSGICMYIWWRKLECDNKGPIG